MVAVAAPSNRILSLVAPQKNDSVFAIFLTSHFWENSEDRA
jgi:hypothetical protein